MDDKPIAIVYLKKEGNHGHKCELYNEHLLVYNQHKIETIPLAAMSYAVVENRKLLLPAIMGGIIACFAFMIIWLNEFDPIYPLLAFLTSMWLLFVGFKGSAHLIIYWQGLTTSVPVSGKGQHIMAFVQFLNAFGKDRTGAYQHIYVKTVPEDQWQNELEGFTQAQIQQQQFENGVTFWEVPILHEQLEVHYRQVSHTLGLQPFVKLKDGAWDTIQVVDAQQIMLQPPVR